MRHRRPFDLGGGPRMAAVQRIDSSVRKPHRTPIPTPLPLTAAAAVDLAAMTLSATAMSNRTADVDTVLGGLTTSATAIGGRLQASTDAMLAELTMSADAASSRTADVDAALGAVTLRADATGSISAALDNVLAELSVSAAVSTSRTAALSSSLAPVTISAIVLSGRTMTLAEALGALSISAAAHTGRVATLSASLAALTGSATVMSSRTAAASVALGSVALSASASLPSPSLPLFRTFTNVSASPLPATAFWSIGHPFIAGEVPSGSIVTGKVGGVTVRLQGMGSITHNDGSLAWTELLIDLSGISLAAGASADLTLTRTVGSWSATTARTNANWTGLVDTVELSSMTTTGTSGNNMDKAGTYTAALDGGGTNTITVTGQGPLGLKGTTRATFVNTGSTHRFLQLVEEWCVFEKADTSAGPVRTKLYIENTMLDLTDPSRFNFNVVWKRGGVTQRSQTDVRVQCGSVINLCRPDGQGDWSANEPSLVVTQDYTLVRATKKIPPFKTGLAYTQVAEWTCSISTSTGLVTATGAVNPLTGSIGSGTDVPTAVDFRAATLPSGSGFADGNVYWLSSTGDGNTFFIYDTLPHAIAGGATGKLIPTGAGTSVVVRNCCGPMARGSLCIDLGATGQRPDIGLITEWGSAYLVGNTQAFQRRARACAYGKAAMGHAWRNSVTGKTPGLLPTVQLPASLGTGLPTAYASNTACSTEIGAGTGTFTGGAGQFTQAFGVEPSHLPSPIFPVWLMEGGDYLRELLYFGGNSAILAKQYQPNRNIQVNGTGTTYNGVILTEGGGSARVAAWALRDIAYAAFAAPDGSDEKAYLIRVLKNNFDWQVADRASKSANYQNMGMYLFDAYDLPSRRDLTIESNFMAWFMGCSIGYTSLLLGDNANLSANLASLLSTFCSTWLAGQYNTNCGYFGSTYHWGPLYSESDYIGSYADMGEIPGDDIFFAYATNGTITWSNVDPSFTLTDGDYFFPYDIFLITPGSPAATAPPSNLTIGRRYYVRDTNVGAKTFKIAATLGGTAITYAISLTGAAGVFHDATGCPSGSAGSSDADGYVAMGIAAMAVSAVAGGGANCPSAYAAAGTRFTGNFNDELTWAFQDRA